MKFASFYYPGFSNCARRNKAAGSVIDEWKIVKNPSQSVFLNCDPVVPALGYTDSSCRDVLAAEVRLAVSYGIDALIFNTYFDGIDFELIAPLNTMTEIKTTLKFAINLCSHLPKRKLPFMPSEENVAPHSPWTHQEIIHFSEIISRQYLKHENYLRINERAVICLYHVGALLYLYGHDQLTIYLSLLRQVCRDHGIELYIIGLFSVAGNWLRLSSHLDLAGFDAISCYVNLPDFESNEPIQKFESIAQRALSTMEEIRLRGAFPPFIACAGAGWNATARGAPGYDPSRDGLRFPYFPVVIDDTPDALEKYLEQIVSKLDKPRGLQDSIIFLGPFNEWSEGCYLLPCKKYGFGRLDAIWRVKQRTGPS